MAPQRLSTMHVVIREGDDYLSRYSIGLVGGGFLVVCVPASLRQQDAFHVVGQLAELASALEQEHGLDREPRARDALMVQAESLREASTEKLDLEEARHVVANDVYREAVVEYPRTPRRAAPGQRVIHATPVPVSPAADRARRVIRPLSP